MISDIEDIRNPNNFHHPDPRTIYRCPGITTQHERISRYILNETVPEEIAIHFATAKNLYFYAWHVYRFYPVAEQHAYSTLEYALKLKLEEYVKELKKDKRARKPTLHTLLKYAIDHKLLKNELFPSKLKWATQIAKDRVSNQVLTKMIAEGLDEIVYDDFNVEPTEADMSYDWLGKFLVSIPTNRNDLAHGSSTLHWSVIHTFDIVSSMINQLYPVAK